MNPHGSQEGRDPMEGACKLFKIVFGWGNVIEFGAQ